MLKRLMGQKGFPKTDSHGLDNLKLYIISLKDIESLSLNQVNQSKREKQIKKGQRFGM